VHAEKTTEDTVLIVEDDKAFSAALHRLFRTIGLRVEVFESATALLKCPLPEVPSCLVLDVSLPELNGLDLQHRLGVDRSDLPRVALLGVVWMAAPLLLFPIGQQWIDSSLAGMLNGAVPIFAAVTAAILLRRLPASRLLVGIAVGFVGVVGVLWPATRDADATALGASLVLLAVLCYGVAVNIAVPLQQRYGALPVLLRAQMVALVLLAPAALVSLPSSGFAWSSTLAVVALGFFGTGWAFVAMTTLVGRVGATRGSVAIYFLPVVAIVLGVVFEDETIAAISLVGTGLVLAGAYLTSRRE